MYVPPSAERLSFTPAPTGVYVDPDVVENVAGIASFCSGTPALAPHQPPARIPKQIPMAGAKSARKFRTPRFSDSAPLLAANQVADPNVVHAVAATAKASLAAIDGFSNAPKTTSLAAS